MFHTCGLQRMPEGSASSEGTEGPPRTEFAPHCPSTANLTMSFPERLTAHTGSGSPRCLRNAPLPPRHVGVTDTEKKYIHIKYGKRAATTVPWVERKQPLPCFVRGEGSHYRALYEEEAATTVPLVLGGSLAQPEVGTNPESYHRR